MRKAVLIIFMSLFFLSSLFAGGNQPSGSNTNQQGKEKVQLWHYLTNIPGQNMEDAVRRYNVLPNAPVIIDSQFIPRNELIKRYALGVVSGDLPEIAFVDNPDSASFAAMGMWIDITDRMKSLPHPNFLPGPLNSGKYNGRQYTLPLRSNGFALWSNDVMLSKAGITKMPETWDELLATCETLKKAFPNIYPLSFAANKMEDGTNGFLLFLLSTGVNWNNIDSPEAIKAFTYCKTLVDRKYISPEVVNWSQNDVEKQFVSGNTAMMLNGSWMIATIRNDDPNMKYTISLIPRDKIHVTTLGGENLGITKAAKGKEDKVWHFIEWILSLEENIPFNVKVETVSPNLDASHQYDGNLVMSRFYEIIKGGIPRGPHPKWPEISSVIQDAIQENLTGAKPSARVAGDAAVKIKAINDSIK